MSVSLTALDATFLELEQQDPGALMSIGGVMVFDAPPGGEVPSLGQVQQDVLARLVALPRYRQRLSSPRVGGLQWPHWEPDPRFDVTTHVRHVVLPAPGGSDELAEWAADFYSHPLDRRRPLWEMALIEGLAGGRWAIAHKTHHCLVDGVGSVDVAYLLLDGSADGEPIISAPAAGDGGELSLSELVPGARTLGQAAHAGAHAARAGIEAIMHPRAALTRARSLADLIVRNELVGAPPSSLNVPIGSTRRFTTITVPLGELKRIKQHLGGSVNDVALAACTTGLRALLLRRDERLPQRGLRAMVPMNVREASEQLGLGNRISSLFVELPVADPVAYARYRTIVARTLHLKGSGAAEGANALLDIAAVAPPVVHATLARSLYATRLFNITITNVPGPQIPLYAWGSRLLEVQPVVPLAAAHAIGIAMFSYDGNLTFGLIADAESTPDLPVLARGIEAGLAELGEIAGAGEERGRARRAHAVRHGAQVPAAG